MSGQELMANPLIAGMVTGLVTAAAADFAAFKSWQSFDDARKYSWSIAAWRWFQGAVIGLITSAGLAGLS